MTPSLRLWLASGILLLFSGAVRAQAPTEDAIGPFEITRFEVTGNSLLDAAFVDRLLAGFAGPRRRFSDVEGAVEALEDAYRALGYSVVRVLVPEQELNQGVVHLQVVETRLGKLRVQGNNFFAADNVRRSVPGLRPGEIPNIGRISSSLRLANENPAKKTTLSLQSAESAGEIDALLEVVDQKTWAAGLTLDNSGDSNTGRTRLTAQYQHFNVAQRDHLLSLQYTTSVENPQRVSVYGAAYHVPLYALGDSLDFYGSDSDVDSGTVSAGLFDLQVSGRGTVYGGRYNHQLFRRGDYSARLIAGLEQKTYRNTLGFQGSDLGNEVSVRPFSLTYAGDLSTAAGNSAYYLSAVANIAGGANGGQADFDRVRAGASPHYTLFRFGADLVRALPANWQLRVVLSGQLSQDLLLPGEQFGAGGASSVRGFREREIAGDQGHVANAELYSPDWCGLTGAIAAQCRGLLFYDTAKVSRHRALPGEQAAETIASAGLGLRLAAAGQLSAQLDWGQVVEAAAARAKGEQRFHFKMNLSY